MTGLFQFAVLLLSTAVTVSPRCVRSSRGALTAPSSWLGMLRELDGGGKERERGERREAFSLQQALFSPHSPGHRTPAGTHLIMHPVWRQGQSGSQKRSLRSFGDYLFHNISNELYIVQGTSKSSFCVLPIITNKLCILWALKVQHVKIADRKSVV